MEGSSPESDRPGFCAREEEDAVRDMPRIRTLRTSVILGSTIRSPLSAGSR